MPAKETVDSDVLRAIPALSGCTAGEQRALARSAQRHRIAAHEVVFAQGEPCTNCYVLAQGQVKLERVTGSMRARVVGFVAPGELLDEAALFASGGYATTALAVTPETLSRTLGKFRRRRWVEARRGRIEVTDPQALQRVAETGAE